MPTPDNDTMQQTVATMNPTQLQQRERAAKVTVEMLQAIPSSEKRDTFIGSLVDAQLAREAFDLDQQMARAFAESGKFDDINGATMTQSIATAMVKIQLGRSWGFNPADAMRYIYFTNGKPAIENEIVAAKLQQAGWAWETEWEYTEEQYKGKPWKRCTGCRLWLKKWNTATRTYEGVMDRTGLPVSEAFTEADADHAMIWEKGKQIPLSQKWNFVSWPRDMYYWRTIGRVKKYHAPNVLRGALTFEERLDVIPDHASPELLPELPPAVEVVEPQPEQPQPRKRALRDKVMARSETAAPVLEDEPDEDLFRDDAAEGGTK